MTSTGIVNWNDALSFSNHLISDWRQGGVILPAIIANHGAGITIAIQSKGLGCHISIEICMHVDDLILVRVCD